MGRKPAAGETLLESAVRRDRAAFESFAAEELPRVRRFLWRLGAPAGEVDDLTQEVFVRLIDSLPRMRRPDRGHSWLFGTAVRVLREAQRRRQVETGAPEVASGRSPHDEAVGAEVQQRVRQALLRRSPALREVLVLSVYEDLPPRQIAAILGLNVGAVRHRLFRARRELETELADWLPAGRELPS